MKKIWRTALTVFSVTLITLAFGQQKNTPSPPPNLGTQFIRLQAEESPFNPTQKKAISYHGRGLAITLVDGKKNLAIEVANGLQSAETVQLPSEVVQVNEIRAASNGRAVVVGMVNGSVYEVLILDIAPTTIADRFLAYFPTVSPDGRFIAFVKFYPPHFVDGTEDHFLLYDTLRSPSENRTANAIPLSDHTNVGQPIYPRVPNRDGDNVDVSGPKHHMMAQGFFWQSDSTRYAFAGDRDGEWSAFVVSVSRGMPQVRSAPLNKTEFCASLHKESCNATLAGAELTPDGVSLDLKGVGADASAVQFLRYNTEELHSIQ